jgi:phosphatidylglycerophosphate synthase
MPQALLLHESPVRLYGLTGRERLRRVLARLGVELLGPGAPPPAGGLILRGDHLYDERVLAGLARSPDTVLVDGTGQAVAAHLAAITPDMLAAFATGGVPAGLAVRDPGALADAVQERLRKRARPYVVPVRAAERDALERRLYGGAYKGVTDLVTKFVWPRPALAATRACARAGITPNQVTLASLLLAVLAGIAFWRGAWLAGLLAGWSMTFLDTVDGKLARVTVTSSRLGDVLDHGLDLVHPPLWYAAWGAGLAHYHPPGDVGTLVWVIVAGYVLGRLAEGAFQVWCARFSLFVWRPFDSLNRLVTARRNPCLLLLTPAAALGAPDWGLFAVAVWTVASSAVLWVRVAQAGAARLRGPLRSWLEDVGGGMSAGGLAARLFSS